MSWGVLMGEITDSSLMAEGGRNACWVFAMMVAKADRDHCLRKDPRMFAKEIDVTNEEYEKAISLITKPDPHSNIPAHEGRRAIPLSELPELEGNRGYFIVNREHYINSLKSSSRDRVISHRKKKKIETYIKELKECNVTVTLCNASLSIFISTSISIYIIKYLIKCHVDLDLWADYEKYRKEIGFPLKTDQGRTAQINKLSGRTLEQQKEILKFCKDGEHRKLTPPEDRYENKKNNSSSNKQSGYFFNGEKIKFPSIHEPDKWQRLADKVGVDTIGLTLEEVKQQILKKLERRNN